MDVPLTIRRARRAGGKRLDLSKRGLTAWPEDLWALRQLEVLDLNGNALASVDPRLSQLEMLEELDLSNNKLESVPDLESASFIHLRRLVLDGNPVASRLPATLLRQLALPPTTPGKTYSQVIKGLLAPHRTAAPAAAPAPVVARPLSAVSTSTAASAAPVQVTAPSRLTSSSTATPPSQLERPLSSASVTRSPPSSNSLSDSRPTQAEDSSPAGSISNGPKQEVSLERMLQEDDATARWRKEQKALLKEVERLTARVAELEASQTAAAGPPMAASQPGLPSWLQKDSRTDAKLSSTLPSRRLEASDEGSGLKEQLKEEQRKNKRLEHQVQKLQERLTEKEMTRDNVGSLPHFDMAEIELGDIINQGGFSVVHKGFWLGTKVAVKKLFDPKINEELLAEFDNEVQKLEQIRHPNILMVLGVHRKPPALCVLMELVEGGSLFQLLHMPAQFTGVRDLHREPKGPLPLKEGLEIMDSTAAALAFLHGRGIAHRDVKTHNVLLTPFLEVKLCDFGLARMKSELMTGTMQFAGTPNYMAPEIFRKQKYSENVDVFAFGTVVWEMMAVDIPFANLDPQEIHEFVCDGKMPPIPTLTPFGLQAVIQACWTLDRNTRPSMAEVLSMLRDCAKDGGAARRPRSALPRGLGASGNFSATGGLGATGGLSGTGTFAAGLGGSSRLC